MSDMSDVTCFLCDRPLERVRYFCRQLLTADDMTVEQEYFRQKLRRHNHYLHGFGVVCGLAVEPATDATHPWQVRVCPGYAVAPQGDEILVPECVVFDLATGRQKEEPCAPCPCPPNQQPGAGQERQKVYLAARYTECSTRPMRVHPAGCACDECACEYSRVRDDFCLAILCELPDCYVKAAKIEDDWLKKVKAEQAAMGGTNFAAVNVRHGLPVPDCLCCLDPWVILATILLPADIKKAITVGDISYIDRRVLYSESLLQKLVLGV